ncbi:MAG: hypothetical protein D4R72_05985 [Nitrosopumilales archaeon]|nr:MAG: hypothetical protein D4R72_05985 [Nitrosopumilales archaeon]
MQVDNQTITNTLNNLISECTKPDYFGWILSMIGILVGAIAIMMTIFIYQRQSRASNEQKQFEKTLVNASRTRIREALNGDRHNISVQMKLVDLSTGNNSEKLAFVRQLMKDARYWKISFADSIMKEADFLRPHIDPTLYSEIQGVANQIKLFVNEELLSANYGSDLETLNNWRRRGKSLIENMLIVASKV